MDKLRVSEPSHEKIKSLSHALGVLNDAADESAHEIRHMINSDYNKIKRVLTEVKPAFGEIKDAAKDSVFRARDRVVTSTKDAAQKVDQSVHQSPWVYLGAAAAASALLGFLMGRRTKG